MGRRVRSTRKHRHKQGKKRNFFFRQRITEGQRKRESPTDSGPSTEPNEILDPKTPRT